MGGRGASSGGGGGGGSGGSTTTLSPELQKVLGKQGKPKGIDQLLQETNPNYQNDRSYRVNCQRCVYAAELAQRGYDVEALPKVNSATDPFNNGMWMHGFEGQTWESNLGSRAKAVELSINDRMGNWGDGSRAIVYVAWKDGGAHVFNVNREKGNTIAFDAQTGKRVDLGRYLSDAKPTKTMLSRVDNLTKPNNILTNAIKKRGT